MLNGYLDALQIDEGIDMAKHLFPHEIEEIEKKARGDWERTDSIRGEFKEFDRFLAYRIADAKKAFKIKGRMGE